MDTPFPFPWAQAVNIVLLMFSLGAPVVIVAHTTSLVAAVLITFAAVQTHIMLNEARTCRHPTHVITLSYVIRPGKFQQCRCR